MVAGDDPVVLLRGIGAVDGADDVPDGAEGVVLLELHVDGDLVAASEVVGEGKRALPAMGNVGAVQRFENGRCILIGERVGGDGGYVDGEFDALGVGEIGRGGYAGGLGVAGIDGQELDGAALDAGGGTEGAFGIGVAAKVAVVGGVGVDEDALGSVLLRDVDLDAAEVGSVADEDDLVFDADAEAGEFFEVGEGAVVGVDDRGGDVAGGRESIEGGQDAGIVLKGVAAVFRGIDVLRALGRT